MDINPTYYRSLTYHINSLGYRGPEFDPEKPDGTFRIIIYGGSQVFNGEMTEGEDWPRQIEKKIRAAGYANVEVINAGIPGHASFDSVGRLFMEGHRFNPDIVVLCNIWNDLKYFDSEQSLFRHFKPRQIDDGRHVRYNYVNGLDRFMSEHSQLYVQLRDTLIFWWFDISKEGVRKKDKKSKLKEGYFSVEKMQLAQYQLNFATFVDIARNIGAEPVLIKQPRLSDKSNGKEELDRINFSFIGARSAEILPNLFSQADQVIDSVGQNKKALILDPSTQMSGQIKYFLDHVHLSEEGTNEMARILSEGLLSVIKKRVEEKSSEQ
ncbi:MAG: hypothetical protein HQL67_05175 [Magnetococcales bacterium]|nr:hypothetical protein [Magnetococcales bacterium]